jgi:hypothetical protein
MVLFSLLDVMSERLQQQKRNQGSNFSTPLLLEVIESFSPLGKKGLGNLTPNFSFCRNFFAHNLKLRKQDHFRYLSFKIFQL